MHQETLYNSHNLLKITHLFCLRCRRKKRKIVTGTMKMITTAAVTDNATTKWVDGFIGSWWATADTWDEDTDPRTPAVGEKGVFFPLSLLVATLSGLEENFVVVGVTTSTGPMKRKRNISEMFWFTQQYLPLMILNLTAAKFKSCLTL